MMPAFVHLESDAFTLPRSIVLTLPTLVRASFLLTDSGVLHDVTLT